MGVAIGVEEFQPERRTGTLPALFARALHQSFVALQPIVSYADRRVFGFEALVRSRAGQLSGAAELVGAAEELGSLRSLGRAVRAQVAGAVAGVPDHALVFVNVHPRELLDPQLASRDAPLSRVASRVVLEVKDGAGLERGPELRTRIAELRRIGFRIAVDDLRGGIGSLDLVSEILPDFAKLDMSLVRHVDADPSRSRIVRHLLGALRDLRIRAIAEGVETPAERDALLSLGKPLLQGFLFGRPAPQVATPSW